MTQGLRIATTITLREHGEIYDMVLSGKFASIPDYLRYIIISDLEHRRARKEFKSNNPLQKTLHTQRNNER